MRTMDDTVAGDQLDPSETPEQRAQALRQPKGIVEMHRPAAGQHEDVLYARGDEVLGDVVGNADGSHSRSFRYQDQAARTKLRIVSMAKAM